jgi:cytochrome d ubiquinol oxidase subunit II
MDLNTLWFVLIGVLFTGFFFLEGFDYGVGTLLPFIASGDRERRQVINTIGPVWDGNEVWMITAGGAMFAAFPHWYATLFSGFYLALVLLLVVLIVRGVAFEFRSKLDDPRWRSLWDWSIFAGSAVPALLWGVAMANLVRGVPIDRTMTYVGGFWNLLNPYALIGGLASLAVFSLHGATFLILKVGNGLEDKARSMALRLWHPVPDLRRCRILADRRRQARRQPRRDPGDRDRSPDCDPVLHRPQA